MLLPFHGFLLCLLWLCAQGQAPLCDDSVELVQVYVGGLAAAQQAADTIAEGDDVFEVAANSEAAVSEPETFTSAFINLLEVGATVTAETDSGFKDAGLLGGGGQSEENVTIGEVGFHDKLEEALPKLQQTCKVKRAASDCERAEMILGLLIRATVGPEPKAPYTHQSLATGMAGLSFFMYFPGPMYAFATLDSNHDGVVQMSEIWKNIPTEVGDGTLLVENGLFEVLDGQFKDGNVTRVDLYEYLRALILVRDVIPSLDLVNPITPTPKCLISARRILQGAKLPRPKLGYYTKLICIFFIFTGTLATHFFVCMAPPKKEVDDDYSWYLRR